MESWRKQGEARLHYISHGLPLEGQGLSCKTKQNISFQQSHVILQPTNVQHKIGAGCASKIAATWANANVTFNGVAFVLNSVEIWLLVKELLDVRNTETYKYCDTTNPIECDAM